MRDFDEMKLARVIDSCNGIDGRVKMQKIVYLLKAMGYPLPFDDFTIRQHGPFSRAVACSADVLKEVGILAETTEELGTGSQGDPVRQYNYALCEEVAPLIREHFDVSAPPGKPSIDKVAARLNREDRAVLEVAATRLFLERESKLTGPDAEQTLRGLKGHLASSFSAADHLLTDLRDQGWL